MERDQMIILGANGQLGRALRGVYPTAIAVDSSELDITNADQVLNYDWSRVGTILNAAAYTNVDSAETPEGRVRAWQVNAVGTRNLTAAALQNGLTLVHISTDYVFDGVQRNHTEQESFSPLSVYGQSKAAGDIVASLVPQHYILRTSWVVGEGKNFVRTMLSLGKKGVSPAVVADQVGRLTFTSELVRGIDHLLETAAPFGTYNLTNDGDPASWAEITRQIFKIGAYNLTVTDTSTAEYYRGKESIAPRPLNSVMDLTKIKDSGFIPRDWRRDLTEYIKKELE